MLNVAPLQLCWEVAQTGLPLLVSGSPAGELVNGLKELRETSAREDRYRNPHRQLQLVALTLKFCQVAFQFLPCLVLESIIAKPVREGL